MRPASFCSHLSHKAPCRRKCPRAYHVLFLLRHHNAMSDSSGLCPRMFFVKKGNIMIDNSFWTSSFLLSCYPSSGNVGRKFRGFLLGHQWKTWWVWRPAGSPLTKPFFTNHKKLPDWPPPLLTDLMNHFRSARVSSAVPKDLDDVVKFLMPSWCAQVLHPDSHITFSMGFMSFESV